MENVLLSCLQWRDLLYGNIIDYKEYKQYLVSEFKKLKLKPRLEIAMKESTGEKTYRHIAKNISIEIAPCFIDWSLEN